MIEKVLSWQKKEVETDYVTGYVLHSVFDVPLTFNQFNLRFLSSVPRRDITSMIESAEGNTGCLINLHGFRASWVPYVTHHWAPELSRTARFYHLKNVANRDLPDYLRIHGAGECFVYY